MAYKWFKYISCSYLSITVAHTLDPSVDSNTSHVLIYPFTGWSSSRDNKIQIHLMFLFIVLECRKFCYYFLFKYISCSYLSMMNVMMAFAGQRFKYISCSYLSNFSNLARTIGNYSNTSHVLIYQIRDYMIGGFF